VFGGSSHAALLAFVPGLVCRPAAGRPVVRVPSSPLPGGAGLSLLLPCDRASDASNSGGPFSSPRLPGALHCLAGRCSVPPSTLSPSRLGRGLWGSRIRPGRLRRWSCR